MIDDIVKEAHDDKERWDMGYFKEKSNHVFVFTGIKLVQLPKCQIQVSLTTPLKETLKTFMEDHSSSTEWII